MEVSLDNIKVMIAIPGGRNPDWETVASLLGTTTRLTQMGIPWKPAIVRGGAIITKVRDELVEEFLKGDCNRLFWIDDDMKWNPDDFFRFLALSTKVDCVAASYVARKDPPTYFVKTIPTAEDKPLSELGLFEVEGVGLGFCCMTREVVHQVARTKPTCFDQVRNCRRQLVFRIDVNEEGNFRGEDMAFFADVRAAGFKVWCDPSIELGHMGVKEYRGRLLDVIVKQPEPTAVGSAA